LDVLLLLLLWSSSSNTATGFYIPGVQPQTFEKGELVDMKVNSMTSIHTQIPRDYYQLPFCKPKNGPKMASENLGEFLTGNKIQNSPYVINMQSEVYCKILCQVELKHMDVVLLQKRIQNGYHHNWIIDNLPSANQVTTLVGDGKEVEPAKHYGGGFPLGFVAEAPESTGPKHPFTFINNHVNINIDYHTLEGEGGHRVVGFSVEPLSIKHNYQGGYQWDGIDSEGYIHGLETCPSSGAGEHLKPQMITENQIIKLGEKVIFTYDVIWKYSKVQWSSRWDVYLTEDHLVPAQVHWYSIFNSMMVVLFLSLLVISILVRNLKRDIAAYNALAALTDEEKDAADGDENDETGWKLIHADVFRPPDNYPMLFCVFVATGVQLCITAGCAILFSSFGFLSPARRGSLMNGVLAFYTLCGVFSGYVSSRLYKSLNGKQWQLCTVLTATLFPGALFVVFLLFNIILAFLRSSGSVPFLDIVIVVFMWCCVSVPLVFGGAYVGYKQQAFEFPTKTSGIARSIPEPPMHMNPMVGMALFGCIPFAAAYVELFFIMTSLWMDQFYYVFGFTLIVYLLLLLTCIEITVLAVYYQLCLENHRWWWYSFFCSGSTAFYLFLYSVFWFQTLHASRSVMTYFLYFGYMTLISFAMMLVFGSVGSVSSLIFVTLIFGTIKAD